MLLSIIFNGSNEDLLLNKYTWLLSAPYIDTYSL